MRLVCAAAYAHNPSPSGPAWDGPSQKGAGQAKVFPEALRNFKLLAIPVLLVLVHLIYWLTRVLRKQRYAHS